MRFASRIERVESSVIRELFKLLGRPGIISLAGGFPDAALFDVLGLREAAQAALEQNPGDALQYGATEGYEPLRAVLAAHMRSKGVTGVDSEDLIVTTGSQQALDLLGKALIDPGDKVLVEGPTFLAAIQCFRLYGAQLITAPVDAYGVDTRRLETLLAQHKPRFIYLIPTFGNPSGATLSLERRLEVLRLAVRHRTLIVEDDPYGDLYFDDTPPPDSLLALSSQVPESRQYVVHCGSLSKVLSPGLRIGWMVADPQLLTKAIVCKQFSDAHTSTFAQVTATHYLRSGRISTAMSTVRATYQERAKAIGDALKAEISEALDFERPRGGMFLWARLTGKDESNVDAQSFAKRAIEEGVALIPGAPFYAMNPDNATLRLSFASVNLHQIPEAVHRLRRALQAC